MFGRCQFLFRLGHHSFWLRAFVVSIGHSSQMLRQCFDCGKISSFETLSSLSLTDHPTIERCNLRYLHHKNHKNKTRGRHKKCKYHTSGFLPQSRFIFWPCGWNTMKTGRKFQELWVRYYVCFPLPFENGEIIYLWYDGTHLPDYVLSYPEDHNRNQ